MKKFFQNSTWFIITIGVYSIGIFVSGFLLLQLNKTLQDASLLDDNRNYWMGFILSELLLGLILMVAFYVQWQRKQAQGDIIYVDRYVSEETNDDDTQIKVLDWNKQREELSKLLKNSNKNQLSNDILRHVCSQLEAVSGAFYIAQTDTDIRRIELVAAYAFALPDSQKLFYEFGEGIAGQVAKIGQKTYIKNIPEGYLNILSGLGESQPSVLLAVPIQQDNTEKEIKENPVKGVIELASFKEFSDSEKEYVDKVADLVAKHL
ncbi:GAF domain-containing protein [Bernardetia sp.]|uniref:GAF domain-containing protein n=1 Tax=Bernardetia sp. TaxID=1937974 RepID=UPI0025B9046B|nr:GAF domain-containing protein [Bernardetia sp.]